MLQNNTMKKIFFTLLIILNFQTLFGQIKAHEIQIKEIFNQALTNSKAYDWLDYLSNQIGGRLSGSLGAERAVKWGNQILLDLELDNVYLENVMVPKWVRGT